MLDVIKPELIELNWFRKMKRLGMSSVLTLENSYLNMTYKNLRKR